jgi:hypothetical protein
VELPVVLTLMLAEAPVKAETADGEHALSDVEFALLS